MRRLLSILILLLLSLPLLSPLAALSGDDEAGLPACCRRNGAHHCAMRMQGQALPANAAAHVPARMDAAHRGCPLMPHAMAAGGYSLQLFPLAKHAALLPPAAHPASAPQAESRRRIAAERARHKRGPPAFFSLA